LTTKITNVIKVSLAHLGEEELEEVRSAFEYGYFGLAYNVDEFETQVGKYIGAKHVVATNTGTSALHIAMDVLGLQPGDEVIVPSLTFVASFQAITSVGATPIPCDVDADTLCMDPKDVEKRITSKTKALMPIHYGGHPCDMDTLMGLKEKYGLRIIEDAAHAFGSTYKGSKIGSYGDITCLSFGSQKNITCGEGGAILSDDEDFDNLCRQKRLLGMDRKSHSSSSWKERSWMYDVPVQGYRYHMSNINAGIGLAQLKKVESFLARRREMCGKYDSALKNIPGIRFRKIDYSTIGPHIYVIRILDGRRDDLKKFLMERDIETGISFIPNHFHSFYKNENLILPETEQAFKEIISLPLHCGLSNADIELIIDGVQDFFKYQG
jgi:dTDP-4-amino-4,6-dideoxygalactose transaminase